MGLDPNSSFPPFFIISTQNQALEAIKKGKQAMVFVHSRKDTVKTARTLVLYFVLFHYFGAHSIFC